MNTNNQNAIEELKGSYYENPLSKKLIWYITINQFTIETKNCLKGDLETSRLFNTY